MEVERSSRESEGINKFILNASYGQGEKTKRKSDIRSYLVKYKAFQRGKLLTDISLVLTPESTLKLTETKKKERKHKSLKPNTDGNRSY